MRTSPLGHLVKVHLFQQVIVGLQWLGVLVLYASLYFIWEWAPGEECHWLSWHFPLDYKLCKMARKTSWDSNDLEFDDFWNLGCER
jgi:hypothetical protein